MTLIDKLNAFLAKFVGPNAAHMLDALIGIAIVGGVAFASSPASRVFLLHHATLGVIVTATIPIATGFASKFRKAAGDSGPLADQLVTAVTQAVKDAHTQSAKAKVAAAAPTVTTTSGAKKS